MNRPVSTQEMTDFKSDPSVKSIGGKTIMGRDNEGNPLFYPNRRERKQMQKHKKFSIKNNRRNTKGRIALSNRFLIDIRNQVIKTLNAMKGRKDKKLKYIKEKMIKYGIVVNLKTKKK
jgi:hypothetical protein